jgi:flagellin-like hook-associated protein FlgL
MIEGMKKVVQHIREQLTEAKADSSNGQKIAELEQEIERKKVNFKRWN